MSDLMMVL